MRRNKILLSIIIATFNSERLLPSVLDSVKSQSFPFSELEILVVDGGSTDATRTIAKKYNCRVLDNPKIVPAWAKYLGYLQAQGKYVMYLDSDEVIENTQSFEKKLELFKDNPQVHAVTGSGYKSPKGYIFLNQYINEFGDPFSFFYYHLSKDYRFFLSAMKKKYQVVSKNTDTIIFDFSHCDQLPIFELVAMASVVDKNYLEKNFPEIKDNPGLIPHLFNLLISKDSYIGIVKNDVLVHYSSDTMKKYFGKITSRVVNNIFTPAKEGFQGRDDFTTGIQKYKRYLFVPYSFTLVFPFLDALYLSLTRRNLGYFIHIPLCFYTSCLILYYMSLKLLGIHPVLKSYGQGKAVAR